MLKTVVTFYTRKGCHLCEKAKEIILDLKENWDFDYVEVDIDGSDELTEKFGLMIPVVEIHGQIVQYGQVDKLFIKKALSKGV